MSCQAWFFLGSVDFLRTLLAIPLCFEQERPQIFYEAPPQHFKTYWALLFDMLFPVPHRRDGKLASPYVLNGYRMLRTEFLKIVNWRPSSDQVSHFCGIWCGCQDSSHFQRRLCKLLTRTVYRFRMRIPKLQEFTAIFESIAPLALGCSLSGLHRKVFNHSVRGIARNAVSSSGAFRSMQIVPAAHVDSKMNCSTSHVDSASWHALAGSRIGGVSRNMMALQKDLPLMLIAIITGTMQQVTASLLGKQHSKPHLYRWVNMRTNPAIATLQFIGSVIIGKHPVVQLLCWIGGFQTLAAFIEGDPVRAHMCRKAFFRSGAVVDVRSVRSHLRFPHRIFVLVNDDMTPEEKNEVECEFLAACPQCLTKGCLRYLMRHAPCRWPPKVDFGKFAPFCLPNPSKSLQKSIQRPLESLQDTTQAPEASQTPPKNLPRPPKDPERFRIAFSFIEKRASEPELSSQEFPASKIDSTIEKSDLILVSIFDGSLIVV